MTVMILLWNYKMIFINPSQTSVGHGGGEQTENLEQEYTHQSDLATKQPS